MNRNRVHALRTLASIMVAILATITAFSAVGAKPAYAAGSGAPIASPHRAPALTHPFSEVNGQCTQGTPNLAEADVGFYLVFTGCDSTTAPHIYLMSCFLQCDQAAHWSSSLQIQDTAIPGTGPGIAAYNNELYIVWAGTDNPTHMWMGYFDPNNPSNTLHAHHSLSDSTGMTPSMVAANNGQLYLAWKGYTNNYIFYASSNDGVHFGPSQYCTSCIRFAGNDTTTAGPAITCCAGNGHILQVAWAGTGSGQQVWTGAFDNSPTLTNHIALPNTTYTSANDVGIAYDLGAFYISFRDDGYGTNGSVTPVVIARSTDGLNWTYSEVCTTFDHPCTAYGAKVAGFEADVYATWMEWKSSCPPSGPCPQGPIWVQWVA
jgi:hypothetical protein